MDYEIKCPKLPSMIDERKTPYTAQYFRLYGFTDGMISETWDYMGEYKTAEDVYKACIENGCTWQTLLGHNKNPKDEWL